MSVPGLLQGPQSDACVILFISPQDRNHFGVILALVGYLHNARLMMPLWMDFCQDVLKELDPQENMGVEHPLGS